MSEQFYDFPVDPVGAAGGRAMGAATVRERGTRRNTCRRLAVTVLSLTLLGAAAGCSTASSRTDPSGMAPSGSASTTSAPDPGRYVAGAWLSENQLPYTGTVTWQADSQVLGSTLNGAVQLVQPDSAFFAASVDGFGTYCSISALGDQALSDQEESFSGSITGSTLPSSPGIPATVRQSTVFYRSQSGAAAAWGAIGSGFAACAKFETGSVSGESTTYPSVGTASRVLNEPNVQCWTNLAAVSHLAPEVTDLLDDVCFVQQGTVISSVDVGFEGPAALSGVNFGTVDATVVSDLQQALKTYGGS